MSEYSPVLRSAILEAIENQLRDGDPPESRQILQRLMAAVCSRKRAVERIAIAVVEIIWEMLHEHQAYDRQRYRVLLDQLE
jgi:hypothetical protein